MNSLDIMRVLCPPTIGMVFPIKTHNHMFGGTEHDDLGRANGLLAKVTCLQPMGNGGDSPMKKEFEGVGCFTRIRMLSW